MGTWYILHVRTGYEDKVRKLIESRINKDGIKISRVVIPTEDVSEMAKGERKIRSRRYWPGYLLVELAPEGENEETWLAVRATSGVLGFLGADKRPVPLAEQEVNRILNEIEDRKGKATPKVEFKNGDKVEVVDGPFVNFTGIVEEVMAEKERLKVSLSIFGRATLLELNYWQVERI